MSIATVSKNEIVVRYSTRDSDGTEWLTIDCPNGWDDVKKLTKKVLAYEGKRFTFTGWNSDRELCFFKRFKDNSRNEGIARIL
jgi:hypothetical protein